LKVFAPLLIQEITSVPSLQNVPTFMIVIKGRSPSWINQKPG